MRMLESAGINYTLHTYDVSDDLIDGVSVAKKCGEDPEQVFKTLVTVGNDKEHYVFVVPVAQKLDLKACAKAAGVKSVEMIPQKELLPLTGYIHGGCSPIGMKKPFARHSLMRR
jgi:Cys-tRNA(Pro)/Cys-tRNA(Cys) deacylase